MSIKERIRGLLAAALVITALSACDGVTASDDPQRDRVGEASVALLAVPTGVNCVVANTVSSVSTSQSFSVAPGTNVSLPLGRLKLGQTVFSGEAYSQACGSIAGQTPAWIADSFTTTLKAGVVATVALTFRRNNPVMATASFVDNLTGIANTGAAAVVTFADGSISGWGSWASFSNLGFGSTPTPMTFPAPVRELKFGTDHACWVATDGNMRCFGRCTEGQLGVPCQSVVSATGNVIAFESQVATMAVGSNFSCASIVTGPTRCWGNNSAGQLGNNTTISSTTPVLVGVPYSPVKIAAGATHACAITRQGHLYCWGDNSSGQLGLGTTTNQLVATRVVGEEPVIDVVAGRDTTCALRADGTVRCWGANQHGTVGDGTTTNRLTPTVVAVGMDVTAIALTGRTACALRTNRSVACWGSNAMGTVGDQTAINRLVPTAVVGLPATGIDRLATTSSGSNTHCGFVVGGGAWCWGDNTNGLIGDGTFTNRFEATAVKL